MQAKRTGSGARAPAARSITASAPAFQASSGSNFCSAPHVSKTCIMRDGLASIRPRDSSCHTRSATSASASPAVTMLVISCMVSGATLKSAKRAANRATRRMRTGSSANASVTWRSTFAAMSRWPPCGSIKCAGFRSTCTPNRSVAQSIRAQAAIELIVKSRRARSWSNVTSGAACTLKPW